MERHELTDRQFRQVCAHLPPSKPHTGRPAKDHRLVVTGIRCILRTGAPGPDLPDRFGS